MSNKIKQEYRKCLDSMAYFINNYMVIKTKDGKIIRPNKVTDTYINNIKIWATAAKLKRRI